MIIVHDLVFRIIGTQPGGERAVSLSLGWSCVLSLNPEDLHCSCCIANALMLSFASLISERNLLTESEEVDLVTSMKKISVILLYHQEFFGTWIWLWKLGTWGWDTAHNQHQCAKETGINSMLFAGVGRFQQNQNEINLIIDLDIEETPKKMKHQTQGMS